MADLLTAGGYNFFDVLSAFQKAVRRGLEDDALYWGTELLEHPDARRAKAQRTTLWNRILVMVSEDIGIAEPGLVTEIRALYNVYTMLAARNDHHPERLAAVHAIVLLVRAKHLRLVDHATNVCFPPLGLPRERREIPAYAYDGLHAGRQGVLSFVEHAQLTLEFVEGEERSLKERSSIPDPYYERVRARLLRAIEDSR